MLRWVRGYQGGKFAAALEHDACFTVLDGAELCRMGIGTVLHMNRPDNVLVAYASVMAALQALAKREYSSGEPSLLLWCAVLCCAVLCCAVPCCAVLCCAVLCCAVLCWCGVAAGCGCEGVRVSLYLSLWLLCLCMCLCVHVAVPVPVPVPVLPWALTHTSACWAP